MPARVRARLVELATGRPLQLAAVAVVVAATAAGASPLNPGAALAARDSLTTEVERAVPAAESAPLELVWQGKDLDGDGKADFANPTGHAPRGHDAYGEGEFHAARDGGSRRHEGVDFMAQAGQPVAAPISGYVTKIGCAYSGDQTLKFVEITNPALHWAARVFYVNPNVAVGDAVAVGHPIGTAHTLQRRYPRGMTDHVHLELTDKGRKIDAARMIVAEYVAPETRVAAAD